MLFDIFDSVKRDLKKYGEIVNYVNSLEAKTSSLSEEELKRKTIDFKERLANGESDQAILPEAFAVVRETAKRALEMRPFDVQIIGGIVLYNSGIAEMKTGEGKTLVATMPLYLNSLLGHGGHLVTVNDYLAKRDALWMGPVYRFLGLSVGVIQHEEAYLVDWDDKEKFTTKLIPCKRSEAYLANITYGTNNEFGFDYLRDHMAVSPEQIVQRELNYAIVDEVDSILIDEARTPLIISGPSEASTEMYYVAKKIADRLIEGDDFEGDDKMKTVTLLPAGVKKIESMLRIDNLYDEKYVDLVKHINQAIKAKKYFNRDVDYIVKEGEVIIVDEFTGRLMFGRRYSDGLHQAIEAKEGLKVKSESQTLATITFQNYFRLYEKLAGMTGTAYTERDEFKEIYNLDVYVIPTNMPLIRVDHPDIVYKTEDAKFRAIVRKIKELYTKGQPVLVGTRSIEKSERLSSMLKKENIAHNVLNAKYHEKEAMIIKDAGQFKSVTIATNMAGRGVDIKLGTNVTEAGGLFVLGTERHEARRIDNQLRGRSGRQGDPGESQFYISLEDELMRIFGGDSIKQVMSTLKVDDNEPIQHAILSRVIESAQKKVEAYNFEIRKNLLDYDNVLEKQREVIYGERDKIFHEETIEDEILSMLNEVLTKIVNAHFFADGEINEDSIKELEHALTQLLNRNIKLAFDNTNRLSINFVLEEIEKTAISLYREKEQYIGQDLMRRLEKYVLLYSVDSNWKDHLYTMDDLKEGIGLRAYGQKDPLIEYQIEGHRLFDEMMERIKEDTIKTLFRVELRKNEVGSKETEKPNTTMSKEERRKKREEEKKHKKKRKL